jgi:hypothetical protein
MLLWHNGKHKRPATVHLFAFSPWGFPHRREQELCLYLKWRRGNRFRHFKAGAYWPRRDLRVGPRFGMASLEVKTWLTGLDEQSIGHLKTFVRFKVGIGGRIREGQTPPRVRGKQELRRSGKTSAYR